MFSAEENPILSGSCAFPPWTWERINDRIEDAGPSSQHELWQEMNARHKQWTANQNSYFEENRPSNTVKSRRDRLPSQVWRDEEIEHSPHSPYRALHRAEDARRVMHRIRDHDKAMVTIRDKAMQTISEDEDVDLAIPTRIQSLSEAESRKQAFDKLTEYTALLPLITSHTFRKRLTEVINKYYSYLHALFTPGANPDQIASELLYLDISIKYAKTSALKTSKKDAQGLKDFLVTLLYEEYVPTHPPASSDPKGHWHRNSLYCRSLTAPPVEKAALQAQLATALNCPPSDLDARIGQKLNAMLAHYPSLSPPSMKARLALYATNTHVTQNTLLVQTCQWGALARKFQADRWMLEKLMGGESEFPGFDFGAGGRMERTCEIETGIGGERGRWFVGVWGGEFELTGRAREWEGRVGMEGEGGEGREKGAGEEKGKAGLRRGSKGWLTGLKGGEVRCGVVAY